MRVLILLSCVAFALAGDRVKCGPLQMLKVKQDWHQVYAAGLGREQVGREIFNEFFFLAGPESREFFRNVRGDNTYSVEFTAHAERLLGGLDMAISLLDQPAVLASQLNHLWMQHGPRKIPAKYWSAFRLAIVYTVPNHLDHDFDQEAWLACVTYIANGVRGKGMTVKVEHLEVEEEDEAILWPPL